MNLVRNNVNFLDHTIRARRAREEHLNRFHVEWHRKPMLALTCIIFFFIGAPLGAIIRKGGMGLPTVFAIVFFLVFQRTHWSRAAPTPRPAGCSRTSRAGGASRRPDRARCG